MSPINGEPNSPDLLRSELRTRHPGIAEEIEGAISTLRKLREIAGPSPPAPAQARVPAQPLARTQADGDPSLIATCDGTFTPQSPVEGTTDGTLPVESSAEQEAPALKAGETFGRYQIVRLLGRGAMGAVYLAYDSQLQRHIALKTPALRNNPQTIDRFFREARSAAGVRSPFVCAVYDVGQVGRIYYLSMAFIDGRPLEKVLSAGQLKDGRAIATVVAKIARGVQKAHEIGIIHRDLKPDNIMIDTDGEPVVMDFGLARRVDDDIRITAAGNILGTPAYMSPEQVEGDPSRIGPPTDIYSLGVILYQMLAGQLPFRGPLTSVLRQIGSVDPPRPSAVRAEPAAGSPLEGVCLRMMAKAPADRYGCMAEVVRALEVAFPSRVEVPVATPSVWGRLWRRCFRPTRVKC